MGFEDEVEQSDLRPCRRTNDRSKRECELTSSIVPRGTSFHRLVGLEFPPIAFGDLRLSCHCGLVHRNSVPSTQMRCVKINVGQRSRSTLSLFHPFHKKLRDT